MESEQPSQSDTSGGRSIAIAVDLSNESAYAVKWARDNYLRPADKVYHAFYGLQIGSSGGEKPKDDSDFTYIRAALSGCPVKVYNFFFGLGSTPIGRP